MPAEDQFLNKLGEIPLVHDGWSVAFDYYTRMKDYNSLTKLTLGAAELSLKKAAEMSSPVLSHVQPQIATVNSYACNKLEDIESKYPLIKQPTEEVREACVEYAQPVISRVKPVVSYVNGVVDNTQKTVNNIKTSGQNLVAGARDLGMSTMSQAVEMTLDSRPGRLVTSTVDYALVKTDSLIDKYIPEEEKESDSDNDNSDEMDTSGSDVEQMEEMPPNGALVALRLGRVGTKLRERLNQRARQDFMLARQRTVGALAQLQQTLDLRDFAKTNLMGAYTKAQEVWVEINKEENHDAEADHNNADSTYAQAFEKRIIAMGRIISRQVKTGVVALESATAEAGLFVKDPISKSREYKDLVYQFGSENISVNVEKARETIIVFQNRLRSMIESLDPPEWLAKNIYGVGADTSN